MNNHTICAIATPEGRSALGIVRISGPLAHQIIGKLFIRTAGPPLLPRRVYFGTIYDGERLIDEVLVHTATAPHSFTGEDTAEINCHGSPYILQEIMRLSIEAGAAPALPGEFSQRAFIHGKIDLAQAEAIADLIASEYEAAHRLSIQQMRGGFSQEIRNLRSALLDFASLIELELDFSEEDVIFADRNQLLALLDQLQYTIEKLCQSFSLGNVLKNGVPTAIVGATNTGKSTLLNALLGEERAIVSDIHGTTRDTIEEAVTLEGIRFAFIDTAGLRESYEPIEQMGIERTCQKIRTASLLLLVLDAACPERFPEQFHRLATEIDAATQQIIAVVNKNDLCNTHSIIDSISTLSLKSKLPLYAIVSVSAKFKQGIDALKSLLVSAIRSRFDTSLLPQNAILITNLRHLHALQEAQKALARVREGLASERYTELIAQDIRQALYDLGSITGDVTTEEILGNIFGKFCIGK